MVPGAVLFMCGVVVLMYVVFSSGGAAKSKQLGVISEVLAGERGKTKRGLFLLGATMALLGTCGAFAGVAAGDAKRRAACAELCTDRGYESGNIQGSQEREPPGSGKHAFVACVCSEGPDPDPLELRADEVLPKD